MLKCSFRMVTREERLFITIHLYLAKIHLLIHDIIRSIDILYCPGHPINSCSQENVFMMYPWHPWTHALQLSDRNLRMMSSYGLQINQHNHLHSRLIWHSFSVWVKTKWVIKKIKTVYVFPHWWKCDAFRPQWSGGLQAVFQDLRGDEVMCSTWFYSNCHHRRKENEGKVNLVKAQTPNIIGATHKGIYHPVFSGV